MGFRPDVDTEVTPLVATEFGEQDPALSPDGRWLAYSSNETGQWEVYVRPFPDVGSSRVRVSTDGGIGPLWAKAGSELFFVDADGDLVAALFETDPEFGVLRRETLFNTVGYEAEASRSFYDISPDDQRFLMGRFPTLGEASSLSHVLVQNFFEELRQRVPN
jgi:Tol biopolymer transport system component